MINSVLFDENIIYFANRCTLIQLILDPRLDENLSRFYRREDWIFLQKKLLILFCDIFIIDQVQKLEPYFILEEKVWYFSMLN